MAILADPSREEHRESSDWVSYILGPWQSFDADAVNVDDINRELRLLLEPAASDSLVDGVAERIDPGARGEFRSYLAGSVGGTATVHTATAERIFRPYSWLLLRISLLLSRTLSRPHNRKQLTRAVRRNSTPQQDMIR